MVSYIVVEFVSLGKPAEMWAPGPANANREHGKATPVCQIAGRLNPFASRLHAVGCNKVEAFYHDVQREFRFV